MGKVAMGMVSKWPAWKRNYKLTKFSTVPKMANDINTCQLADCYTLGCQKLCMQSKDDTKKSLGVKGVDWISPNFSLPDLDYGMIDAGFFEDSEGDTCN